MRPSCKHTVCVWRSCCRCFAFVAELNDFSGLDAVHNGGGGRLCNGSYCCISCIPSLLLLPETLMPKTLMVCQNFMWRFVCSFPQNLHKNTLKQSVRRFKELPPGAFPTTVISFAITATCKQPSEVTGSLHVSQSARPAGEPPTAEEENES